MYITINSHCAVLAVRYRFLNDEVGGVFRKEVGNGLIVSGNSRNSSHLFGVDKEAEIEVEQKVFITL
jgi:hypothetical protein